MNQLVSGVCRSRSRVLLNFQQCRRHYETQLQTLRCCFQVRRHYRAGFVLKYNNVQLKVAGIVTLIKTLITLEL